MKKSKTRNKLQPGYWHYPQRSKALELALYYGFTPSDTPLPEKQDKEIAKSIAICPDPEGVCIYTDEKVSLMRGLLSTAVPPLPITQMYERSAVYKRKDKKCEYCFDVLGSTQSIADALIIKSIYELVVDYGLENISVEINSVGDRDSFGRFTREYGAYARKHLNEFDPECRQLIKKNPFAAIECTHEKCRGLAEQGPRPINYLSEPSRNHFKECLEHLEMSNVPYSINTSLLRHYDVASHTVFAIYGTSSAKKGSELVSYGFRWTGIAKKIGHKKDIPSVSATVCLEKKDFKIPEKIKKPQVYFIQVGHEAKLKSLSIIETLRKAGIPLYHSLSKDKFTAQLGIAEHLKVPYILIMGQKESMDNTLLVRKMESHSQDTVRIDKVEEYLKKLLK